MAGMQWRISACLVASKSKNFFTKFLDFFYFPALENQLCKSVDCGWDFAAGKDVSRDQRNFYGNQNEEGKEN